MNKNYELGQKIKNFRKRAGKSQMELELEIDASPGSLSRIESGEVNPTKETLLKIIDVLGLVSYEAASLFDIDFSNMSEILKISKELYESENHEELLQKAVNAIVFELNFIGSFVSIIEGDSLRAITSTQSWYSDLVMKIISVPFNSLTVSLSKDINNLIVKTVTERKVFISNKPIDFLVPAVSKSIGENLLNIVGVKSGISFPIIHKDRVLGVIFFCKTYEDSFEKEIQILQEFVDYIASILYKFLNNNYEYSWSKNKKLQKKSWKKPDGT